MRHSNSKTWKWAIFTGTFCALGCSAGATGGSVDDGSGANQVPSAGGELPVGSALEWQLDPAAAHTAILEGAQVERTEEQRQEGDLLYEIRLSDTKVVQFLEVEPGQLAVSYTGSSTHDARPPEEYATLAPTELFARITGESAPERLAAAEFAAIARDDLRAESGIDNQVGSLEGGPEADSSGAADARSRKFLASQWWIQAACSGAGIDYHFTLNGQYYHRMVGCWADLYTKVGTGDLGITLDFRIVGDGTNGTAANLKYWYINCETFIIQVCDWKNKNYGVTAGTYRELKFYGRQTRAAEYTHPTGGYFAVKYNGISDLNPSSCPVCSNGTICPKVNCIYHNQ